MLNLKLGTHVNRVVVVDLARASRAFLWVLRFSSLHKINTWLHVQTKQLLPEAPLYAYTVQYLDLFMSLPIV